MIRHCNFHPTVKLQYSFFHTNFSTRAIFLVIEDIFVEHSKYRIIRRFLIFSSSQMHRSFVIISHLRDLFVDYSSLAASILYRFLQSIDSTFLPIDFALAMIRGYLYLFLFNFSSRLCLSFPLSFIERTSPLSRRLLQSVNSNLLHPSFSSIPFELAVSSVNLSFSFSSLIPSPHPLHAFVPRHVDFREASIVSSRFFFFSSNLPIFTLPGLTVRLGDPLSTFA